jgi:gliding motility-associated lipoprotein GldH
MKYISFIILVCFIFLLSCSPNRIFEEHRKIPGSTWNMSNSLVFEFDVKDTSQTYDIYIAIRHVTNYPYKNLLIGAVLTSPDGEIRYTNYDLKIRNKDGEALGNGMGELWDLNIPLRKEFKFHEPGKCILEIENRMSRVKTPGILEIGLIVEKH